MAVNQDADVDDERQSLEPRTTPMQAINHPAVICYVGIGANLELPAQQNVQAWQALDSIPRTRVRQVSSLYKTAPMGPQDQPPYINSVAEILCGIPALALLDTLQEIENEFGRVRSENRWIARTLDLDILLYGDQEMTTTRLTIPHVGVLRRSFVLHPLLEIAPEVSLPGKGQAREFIAQVESLGIEKLAD